MVIKGEWSGSNEEPSQSRGIVSGMLAACVGGSPAVAGTTQPARAVKSPPADDL
jgi:hypothetical protein